MRLPSTIILFMFIDIVNSTITGMPNRMTYIAAFSGLMMILPFTAEASVDGQADKSARRRSLISYSVSNNSWLALKGTTNINSFECLSAATDSRGYMLADASLSENKVGFTGADILLNVKSFDCKNALITRDMHNALGSSNNPEIEIKLLDAIIGETYWRSQEGSVMANILITINGISKTKELIIDWQRYSFEYRFEGTAELSMTEFDIDPPSPALGMVKVNDSITVSFNYSVKSEEISRLD